MENLPLKLILSLMTITMFAACSSSKDAPTDTTSINYTPLNYTQAKYTNNTVSTPFYQAINFSKNLVDQNDPSTLIAVTYEGESKQLMPDSRSNSNTSTSSYLFAAAYVDKSINIYVNSAEFGERETAEQEAMNYAQIIGQIPAVLRNGIADVYLHKGSEPLVGTDNYLIIYTDFAESLNNQGILEEVLIHEAVHVSLDAELSGSNEWRIAQSNDGAAISQLATERGNEDAAESLLAYLAVRYRANRVPASVDQTILATIPDRIQYLDARGFDMHPIAWEEEGKWLDDSASEIIDYQGDLFTYYEQWEQKVSF